MASVQDQLQCCLLLPRTQQQQDTKTNTHTRSKTKTDEAPSGSTQKQRPTVSANPHLPKEDRRVRQLKLSSVCQSLKIALHYLLQNSHIQILLLYPHSWNTKTKVETRSSCLTKTKLLGKTKFLAKLSFWQN